MRLDLSVIKAITLGAVRVTEEEDGFHFYRFSSEQEKLYKDRSDDFYKKSFSTSDIHLSFQTNSRLLYMKGMVSSGSSRQYYAFDIFVNGEKIDTVNNFTGVSMSCDYTGISLPMDAFSKEIFLGEGTKEVCIYFPWSAKVCLQALAVDDHAFVTPVRPGKKLLCFGDSITQGYDALFPSNQYTAKLGNFLHAQVFNKGIGGEIFFPELAQTKENFVPDYITVAYGVNDWYRCQKQEFIQNCSGFFANLTKNYPDSRIFVITPIWCKSCKEVKEFGKFEEVSEIIHKTVENYENVFVVSGFDFVTHDEVFFADLQVHPNDQGFEQYFENLVNRISGYCHTVVGELFDLASKKMQVVDEVIPELPDSQVTVLVTDKGNFYTSVNDVTGVTCMELAEKNDTKVVQMLAMWKGGCVDLPSYMFRKELLALNPKNKNTNLVLQGENGYVFKKLSATMP